MIIDRAGVADKLLEQIPTLRYISQVGVYSPAVMHHAERTMVAVFNAWTAVQDEASQDELYWLLERVDAAMRELTVYCKTNICPPEGVVAERVSPKEPDPRPWPLLPDWYPRPQWD